MQALIVDERGVVHQDVDSCRFAQQFGDDARPAVRVGHIQCLVKLISQKRLRRSLHITEKNHRTFASEGIGNSAPDPTGGAGHDG
ncbi:hypothetical protein D3C78_840010 [compost metagenome]